MSIRIGRVRAGGRCIGDQRIQWCSIAREYKLVLVPRKAPAELTTCGLVFLIAPGSSMGLSAAKKRDRVQLAQRLVSTVDDEVESDTEALWFAEAERRLEELRIGKVQGIPKDGCCDLSPHPQPFSQRKKGAQINPSADSDYFGVRRKSEAATALWMSLERY